MEKIIYPTTHFKLYSLLVDFFKILLDLIDNAKNSKISSFQSS